MAEESEHQANNQPIVKPPFHQRFSIHVRREEAERRFINRITNALNEHFEDLEKPFSDSPWAAVSLNIVASALGEKYDNGLTFSDFVRGNFNNCLLALEALYKVITELKMGRYQLDELIEDAIKLSETDLGIEWHDGSFWPSGAKLLDEALLNENLKWLQEKTLHGVLVPFEKGLRHFLEAHKQPGKLADTVTDMYEALEAMAKLVTGKDKDLSGNKEKFICMLKLSHYYNRMLGDYIDYANEYRHGIGKDVKRELPKRNEVEAFFYTTGLFIRLSIQQLTSQT